ncbi:BZ3500_MvSof-1268-A1-R1_Chr11-1g03220 [Microbotryum saponariae]|uniref:BZ3500_MvSof-1268-A1-R1_Chr11-1g03220 protein n=1 Tax=Microbotryum saponariae TaxID=289078 RepID=A0A2X0NCF9_9BASI|nr:BZ3501_MvSof-1269-A2-R1_Chr11g02795 [Microbotryum saponariae]SDA03780.1 BZ3500_MvSof-1268-A1-R1_Chr11-1g03220 [Microbotryum saponariae]
MSALFRKRSDDGHAMLAPDDPYYVRQAYSSSSVGGDGRAGSSFSAPSFDDRFIHDEDREVFLDRNGRGLGYSKEGNATFGKKKLRSFPWAKSKPTSIVVPQRTPSPRPTTPTSMAPLPPSPVTPISDQFTTHGLGIYTTTSPGSVASLSPGRATDSGPTLAQFPAPPSSLPSVTSTLSSDYSSIQSVPSRMHLPLPKRRSSLIAGIPSGSNGSGGHAFNGSVSTVSTFETTSSFASSKLFHSSVDDYYDSSSDATTMSSLTSSPESKTRRTTNSGRRMWKTKGLQESPLRPDQVLPPSQQHRRDDGLRPPCEEDEDAYFASTTSLGATTSPHPIPYRRNSTPMPDFVAAMLGIEPETPPRPKRWSASSNKPAAESPPFDLAREKAAARRTSQQTVRPLGGNAGAGSDEDADDEVSPPRPRPAPSALLDCRSRIPSIRFEGFAMDSVFAEFEQKLLRSKTSSTSTPTIEVAEAPAEERNPFLETAAASDHETKLRERKSTRRRTRVISAYRPSEGYFNVEEDEVTLSPAPQVMDALRSESPLAAAYESNGSASSAMSLPLPSSSSLSQQQLMVARPRPGPRRAQTRPARLDVDLANSLTEFHRGGLVTPTSASTVTPYGGVVSPSADSVFSATTSEGTIGSGDGAVSPVSIVAPASAPSSPPAPVVLPHSVANVEAAGRRTPPMTPISPVDPTPTAASPPSPPPTRPPIPSVFVFPPNGPSYRRGESSDWEAPPKPPMYAGPTKVTLVQPKRMIRASTRPVSSLPKRNVARQPLIVTPIVVAGPSPGPLPPSPALSSTSTIHPQRRAASPVGWSFPPREQLPSPPSASASASASVSARGSPDLSIRPASFSPSDESGSDCDPLQTMMSRLNAPHTPPRAAGTTHSTSTPTTPRGQDHPNGLTMMALLRHTSSQTGLSMLERELGSLPTSSSTASFEGGPQILVTAPPHDDDDDNDEEIEHVDHGLDDEIATGVAVPVPHLMRAASKSSTSSSGVSTNVDTILTTYESDDSVTRYGDAPLLHSNVAPPLVPIIIDNPTVPDSEHARSLSGSSSSSSSFSYGLGAEDHNDDDALSRGFSDESLLSPTDSEVDPLDVMSREIEDTLAEIEESVASSSSMSIASLMMGCSVTPKLGGSSLTPSPTCASEDAFGTFPDADADSAEEFTRGSAIPVRMKRSVAATAAPSHSRNWSDVSCSTIMTDSTESSTSSSSTNSSDEHHAEIAVVMTGQRISRRTVGAVGVGVFGQAM